MKYQKGFSLVEGLLIVLILFVVGFAGYYVWSQNQDEQSKEAETSQQQNQTEINQVDSEDEEVSIPEEWQVYNDDQLEFSFTYPKDWTITESQNEYNLTYLTLTSPDFVEYTDGGYGGTLEGTRVFIYVNDLSSEYVSTNEQIKSGEARKPAIYTEIKDIETNGNKGISFIVGYEGPRSYTFSYENSDKVYRLTLEEITSSDDDIFHPNIETFEQVVETFRIDSN